MRAYLTCGVLACGFLQLKCESCGKDRLLPLSCKGRSVCPSCCGRSVTGCERKPTRSVSATARNLSEGRSNQEMADTAAHLLDRVFPRFPARQWVFSLPFALPAFPNAWPLCSCRAF